MPGAHRFVTEAFQNCISFGIDAKLITDASSIRFRFPADVPTGSFGAREGYANPIGGWVEAGRATLVGIERAKAMGATVRPGAEVNGFIKEGRKVLGVNLKDGEEIRGDLVISCAGAW
jgi:sarcosine oxidase/L-pipecolate oxidase